MPRIYYRCKDRQQRNIIWFQENYQRKSAQHPEIISDFNSIIAAIQSPSIITKDIGNNNRLCYYLYVGDKTMKVVIYFPKLSFKKIGIIITAYYVNRIKPTEKIIWIKKPNNN